MVTNFMQGEPDRERYTPAEVVIAVKDTLGTIDLDPAILGTSVLLKEYTIMITTHEVHYVIFSSPGSFVSEERQKKIDAWSPTLACKMYEDITERHGAKPYGFKFITMIEAEPVNSWEGESLEVKPKLKAESKMYFINGVVETLAEVEARNDPKEDILCSNMRCNEWGRIVTTRNSFKHCAVFNDGDCVVDLTGKVIYS